MRLMDYREYAKNRFLGELQFTFVNKAVNNSMHIKSMYFFNEPLAVNSVDSTRWEGELDFMHAPSGIHT